MDAERLPVFSRRVRQFKDDVLSVVAELAEARRDLLAAKVGLAGKTLSPVAKATLVRSHDTAARRVTAARFALDTALDASEGP